MSGLFLPDSGLLRNSNNQSSVAHPNRRLWIQYLPSCLPSPQHSKLGWNKTANSKAVGWGISPILKLIYWYCYSNKNPFITGVICQACWNYIYSNHKTCNLFGGCSCILGTTTAPNQHGSTRPSVASSWHLQWRPHMQCHSWRQQLLEGSPPPRSFKRLNCTTCVCLLVFYFL